MTDKELIDAYRKGNHNAFARFYDNCKDSLYSYIVIRVIIFKTKKPRKENSLSLRGLIFYITKNIDIYLKQQTVTYISDICPLCPIHH